MVTWTVKPLPESERPEMSRGMADWQLLKSGRREDFFSTKSNAESVAKRNASDGDTIKLVSTTGSVSTRTVDKVQGVDNFFDQVL